jgi:glutaconate CoA-transferase subunit A
LSINVRSIWHLKEFDMKLMSLVEAAALVRDGDMVAFGGMTLYRKPVAFARELVRRGVRDLTFVAFTGSIEVDLLAAGGCLREVRACYIGLEYIGLAPVVRREVERGRLIMTEETENSIVIGLQAALMHVPYLPTRECCVGSDYFTIRSDFRRAPCPVTGEMLTWFPAIRPRIGVIHVPIADQFGNAVLRAERCVDVQIATAAELTILTAERVVDTDEIKRTARGAEIVQFMVDAVVEAPGGAHPTSCAFEYPTDVPHLIEYVRSARTPAGLESYLERFVRGPADLTAYMAAVLVGDNADVS